MLETEKSDDTKYPFTHFIEHTHHTECHPYSYLGISYLRDLLTVTSEDSDDVPTITQLFEKYDILDAVDPSHDETTVGDFKRKISAAAVTEKLLQKGIVVDFDKIYPLYAMGKKLTTKHIREIESLADDQDHIYEYIDDLIHNQGVSSCEHESQPNYDIISNVCRMCDTIDFIIDDDDLITEIDIQTIQTSISKLQALSARCEAVQSC